MTTTKQPEKTQTPALIEKNITDNVLARINAFKQSGGLKLPTDYSPENAMKAAWLMLQDVKTKDGKLAVDVCDKTSVANSLLKMVIYGLTPMKKQCYFIVYGNSLQCSVSYFGNIATAKRVGLKNIVANVIYQGDEFIYSVDTTTGRHKIEKHDQSIENIDITKIKGAYAVIEMEDGTKDVEIMTMNQINKAWLQGAANGKSPAHNNFGDEMAKKSVINRACKKIINSSNDSYLYDGDDQAPEILPEHPEANGKVIDISDNQPAQEPKPEEKPEPVIENAKQGELTGPGF